MALKEPTSNDLIPILLDKFSEYTNKIKDRIKINSIFSEFNEKTSTQFDKFIKMSQLRYKGIKSGNSLENMLEKQKPKYNQLSKNILEDIFYNTTDIDDENKKLLKKPNKKENKDLADLRREIIIKTRDFSKNEIRNREKLDKIIMKKRLELQEKEKNKTFTRLNYNYEPHSYKKRSPKKKTEIKKNESYNNEIDNEEAMQEQKDFFEVLMNEDTKFFNDNIKEYKDYLIKIREKHKNDKIEEKKEKKSLKNKEEKSINEEEKEEKKEEEKKEEEEKKIKEEEKPKFQFLTDNIKLLYFKEDLSKNIKPKKKEEPKIDIKKLMRYTKRGKSAKWFYPNINNTLNKKEEEKIIENKKEIKEEERPKSNNVKFKKVFSPTLTFYSNNNDINNSIQSTMGLTSTTGFSNFRNTIQTIRNEAEKVKFIDENFDKKWDTMENFFKKNELLPKLEKNDSVKSTLSKNDNLNEDNNKNNRNFYWRRNRRNILNAFEKTYKEKKIEWKKDEEKRELEKKKEEEERIKIKNYLKEIKGISRKPQLYIDCYSKRDGKTNQRITQFNNLLNGNYYNKKNLENKVSDFFNKIQYKEKEKELFEKELHKQILEQRKTKESELQFEMCKKIWANLDNEEIGEDVIFNYQVNGGQINNTVKIDPYKEYLEFYNIMSERESFRKEIQSLKNEIDFNNKNKNKFHINNGIKNEDKKNEKSNDKILYKFNNKNDEKKNGKKENEKNDKIIRKRIQIKSQRKENE